jgi:hypothetical protein
VDVWKNISLLFFWMVLLSDSSGFFNAVVLNKHAGFENLQYWEHFLYVSTVSDHLWHVDLLILCASGKNKIRDCNTGTGGEIAGAKPIGEQWGNPYLGLVARLYSHLRSPNQSENLFQLALNSSSRIKEANSL